jgi:hypothetical protein
MVGSCDRVDPASGVPTCGTCGYRTDAEFTDPRFRLRKKNLDFSCCYDGAIIVSDRFRILYESLGGTNMQSLALPAAPGFYHLKSRQPIFLDYPAMETRRSRFCSGCHRYLDVIGYSQIVPLAGAPLPEFEMAFSDWYFGSNNEASPLVLCGAGLASALRSSSLKGIDSVEALGV